MSKIPLYLYFSLGFFSYLVVLAGAGLYWFRTRREDGMIMFVGTGLIVAVRLVQVFLILLIQSHIIPDWAATSYKITQAANLAGMILFALGFLWMAMRTAAKPQFEELLPPRD